MDTDKINLAFISNSLTPYRVHLHHRIMREIPQVELWMLCTHEDSAGRWQTSPLAELRAVNFGKGQPASQQGKIRHLLSEWRKAGRIIDWLNRHAIGAVLIGGYNDIGRLRIIRWCRHHDIPCFLAADSNICGDRAAGIKAVIKRVLLKWIITSCTGVMPCGQLGQAYFEKYGADRSRIFLSPYEPDYDLIRNLSEKQIDATRNRFELPPDRRYLIYSGRLVSVKRVDLLIEAYARITARRPEWDLLLVGDGPLRQQLQAAVPEKLHNRIRWLGFLDDQTTVSALYRLSDVLVLPSDFEPWALVVNEAVAAGLAVVASDVVGAAAELVRDGVNGHVFPHGDREALTQSLLGITDEHRLPTAKAASTGILEDWRKKADPIAGIKKALQSCGAIPS